MELELYVNQWQKPKANCESSSYIDELLYNVPGIEKIDCNCRKSSIGQTGRTIEIIIKEH